MIRISWRNVQTPSRWVTDKCFHICSNHAIITCSSKVSLNNGLPLYDDTHLIMRCRRSAHSMRSSSLVPLLISLMLVHKACKQVFIEQWPHSLNMTLIHIFPHCSMLSVAPTTTPKRSIMLINHRSSWLWYIFQKKLYVRRLSELLPVSPCSCIRLRKDDDTFCDSVKYFIREMQINELLATFPR